MLEEKHMPKFLLSRSGLDNHLPAELDINKWRSVAPYTILWEETESRTLEGIQHHCICECAEGEAEEATQTNKRVINVIIPNQTSTSKPRCCVQQVRVMVLPFVYDSRQLHSDL